MNFNLQALINKRELIFAFLIILMFISFIISYAINSITVFLFFGFFFLDTKLNIKKKWILIKKNKLVWLYVVFFLIQLIGVLYSENKSFAIRRVEIMVPILFLPSILSVEQLSANYLKRILSLLKYLILFIFSIYLAIHLFIDGRVASTFVHFTIEKKLGISQFYLTFVLILPLLESLRQLKKRKKKLANTICFSVALYFLLLLGNKTTILFLIILFLIYLVRIFKKNIKLGLLYLLTFSLLSIIAFKIPIVNNKLNIVFKTTDLNIKTIITKNRFTITKNTLEHRILINYLASKEIISGLPFGFGTGDYKDKLYTQFKKVKFKYAVKNKINTHNQYFEEFLKTGFLGGMVFILIIFSLLKISHLNSAFAFPIILFFAIACIVESYLVRQHGVVIFSFFIPLFLYNKTTI